MSGIEIRALRPTARETRDFVRFPALVYAGIPQWVPPLYGQESARIRFGPFHAIGECRLLMAFRSGRPVARMSVHRNRAFEAYLGTRQGFFGFFEALPDDPAVRAMLDEGAAWLAGQGCERMIGPCSFTVYDQVGILMDAYEEAPVVMCPYNPPYYPGLLEAAGFERVVDWYAYLVRREDPFPKAWERIADRVLSSPDVLIRPPDLSRWNEELALGRDMFNEAWAANWGHAPISEGEWNALARELKQVIRPELTHLLFVRGEPAGFSITLPDLNIALKAAGGRLLPWGWLRAWLASRRIRGLRTIAMGVRERFRGHGYEIAMIVQTIRVGRLLGYERCDCSLVVETNKPMIQLLEGLGATRYKTFRVYGKVLAPGPGARE